MALARPQMLASPRATQVSGRRLVAIATLITALSFGPTVSAVERNVTVTLTEHGIPHVVAEDWNGLGYGEGYALARNDLCSIANAIATYSGRRAQRYGMAGAFTTYAGDTAPVPNAQEDLVQRFLIDDEVVKLARAKMSSRALALVDGFAAGYNAYVAALPPAKRPEACRGAGVIQPITGDDMIRRIYAFAILDGAEAYRSEVWAAAPPSPERKAEALPSMPAPSALGSNALAIGRDLTANGSGLLLANPRDSPDHPWPLRRHGRGFERPSSHLHWLQPVARLDPNQLHRRARSVLSAEARSGRSHALPDRRPLDPNAPLPHHRPYS